MRVTDFMGMAPSTIPTNLRDNYAQLAENCELYSGAIEPFKRAKVLGHVVDINGVEKLTPSRTIHKAGDIWVGFDDFTFICPDPQNRAGSDSFLYVQNGSLYRSSPRQIMKGTGGIKVGIEAPLLPPVGVLLPGQGCPPTSLLKTCYDGTPAEPETTEDCDPNADIPTLTTYRFTYMTACDEESAPSDPSNYVDVMNGDAVVLSDPSVPPANAVKRLWYRSMSTSKGEVYWAYVGESSIADLLFTDNKCLFEVGEMLTTDNYNPPPFCLEGVALIGNTVTVLWSGNKFWLSEPKLPYAYKDLNGNTLRFDIVGMYEVTDAIESPKVHYDCVALTRGYAYTIACLLPEDLPAIQELQISKPALRPDAVAIGGGKVFYTTEAGIYSITGGNVQEVTSMFTEVEWAEFRPHDQLLAYWDNRVWGFNPERGFVITVAVEDERRRSNFVVITKTVNAAYAAVNTRLTMLNGNLLEEWGTGDGYMRGLWRSKTYVQNGLWSPVRAKVCGTYERSPRGAQEAIKAYKLWQHTLRNTGSIAKFVARNPEQAKYVHLFGRFDEDTTFSLTTEDTVVYQRVCPLSGQNFTLPRKRMGVDWWFEVTTTDIVREVHVQTGGEDLTQEGGMA